MTPTVPIPASKPEHKVPELRARAPESLIALATLYFATQVAGQAEATVTAKRRDLQRFLSFFLEFYGHDHPPEWYPAVTRAFIKALQHDPALSGATVSRIYCTVRHFARWADANADAFPQGGPTDGVKPPEEPPAAFHGLSRKNQLRLLAAAETLCNRSQPGINQGMRNRAIVHCLLASALRVSELIRLELAQYDGRVLTRVLQKGGARRRRVPLNREARAALDAWIVERGDAPGPLFSTRTARPITRSKVYEIVKAMEAQANAHLPEAERFTVTPHTLRHTRLRAVANEKGLHYARKLSGHKSDRYIWRYIQPAEEDFEEALDALD